MGIVKFLVFFFVFLRFFPHLIEGAPTVQFPFTLKGHGREECGSPGYQLTCDEMNKTVLELPFSGKFFVRSLQKIEIYDPENCLPKRIPKLNLSGTPYQLGSSYRKYLFLNCSSSGGSLRHITKLIHISCLSSSTHTVFATNVSIANIAPLNITCVHIADVQVPILPIQDDDSFNLNEKFFLTLLGVFIGIPFIILLYFFPRTIFNIFANVCLVVFFRIFGPYISNCIEIVRARRAFRRAAASYSTPDAVLPQLAVPHQPPIVRTGLSDSTIQSYPTVVLGESGRLPNPNYTSCTICIADFQAKDTLKSMPTCNHCFHAKCLEQWLRVNATCPVCRKSPLH
ncbi:hypothetical protein MKW98_017151 [Papaver atlanticum]|uniref:RING-type E3 ubiquitin transferase n=1 Tax=Papaver atlanticum TaxID=357466 RepID=A0AAD4SAQ1_9MAGN|nr:hypothetical protein MKW98_017151 [Papaver atlanticum]